MRVLFGRAGALGRLLACAGGLCAALLVGGPVLAPLAAQQVQLPQLGAKDQLAGLQWRFTRIRYNAFGVEAFQRRYWSEPWAIDAPAAEQNLSRRVKSITNIKVLDPIVLTLQDEELWNNPWIYFVEPGNMRLKDEDVPILREFLLRGGTAMLDDFHGPIEWANVEQEFKRVFPERDIVDLPPSHPVYHCFYDLDDYPQIPGLGSFFAGRTWEKGGFVARLRAIQDDRGRAMVLINWNTDMGDGWEWSNAEEYPGYIKYTAEAYRMVINEIVYSLTH